MTNHTSGGMRGMRIKLTCVKLNMHELAQNNSVAFLTTVEEPLACAAGKNTYFTEVQTYRPKPNFLSSECVLLYRSTQHFPTCHASLKKSAEILMGLQGAEDYV